MSTPARVAAFVVALAVAFLGARGIGAAVGPLDVAATAPTHESRAHESRAHESGGHESADHTEETSAEQPAGLAVASEGYTLRVVSPGRAQGSTGRSASSSTVRTASPSRRTTKCTRSVST